MLHEITTSEKAQFWTMTYDPEHLPVRGNDARGILVKSDLQKFFKRLRKSGYDYRYYACGEYGDVSGRPHYHAIAFGIEVTKDELERHWKLGLCEVGTASEASIRYVAGYVSKKLGLRHKMDDSRPAAFQISSQGIGLEWAKENMVETLFDGHLKFRGKKLPIPRYYVEQFEKIFPEAVEGFSARRAYESDLALSDEILKIAPEFGGRAWSQLDELEKGRVIKVMTEKGKEREALLIKQTEVRENKL
jgi:hypothetical protein